MKLWSAILKQWLRKFREFIIQLTLKQISLQHFILPFIYIYLQRFSKKYLVGGLRGYKIFSSNDKFFIQSLNQNFLRASYMINSRKIQIKLTNLTNKKIHKSLPYYANIINSGSLLNSSDKNKLKILTLLPKPWARNIQDFGFSHTYHILKTAELVNLSIIDNPTISISSNPLGQLVETKKKEWDLIEDRIIEYSPNIIIISGHKRSFDPLNKATLIKLKTKYNIKVLLLMLDDWSDEYSEVVKKWGEAVDKILVYETKCAVSSSVSVDKILIWPFPRLLRFTNANEILYSSFDKIKFIGSPYLNRIPWLFFISIACLKYPNLKLDINSSSKIGEHPKTVGDYLNSYSAGDVTLHFLERTPDIYTFTSSVWDAFSGGALVIAQVGEKYDPIADFFRPGIDYLPFTTLNELLEIIDKLYLYPDLIYKISKSGKDFMADNYNANKLYNYLAKEIL